jgi:hypothetical protein
MTSEVADRDNAANDTTSSDNRTLVVALRRSGASMQEKRLTAEIAAASADKRACQPDDAGAGIQQPGR